MDELGSIRGRNSAFDCKSSHISSFLTANRRIHLIRERPFDFMGGGGGGVGRKVFRNKFPGPKIYPGPKTSLPHKNQMVAP